MTRKDKKLVRQGNLEAVKRMVLANLDAFLEMAELNDEDGDLETTMTDEQVAQLANHFAGYLEDVTGDQIGTYGRKVSL